MPALQFLLCLWISFEIQAEPRKPHDTTSIRVRLGCCARQITFHTFTKQLVTGVRQWSDAVGLGQRVELVWKGRHYIEINGHASMEDRVSLKHQVTEGAIVFNGKSHRGILHISAGDRGLEVINELPLEEYLAGTLAAEMSSDWEIEALKAQAVASRSFALDRVSRPRNELYDLEGSTQDQAFDGGGIEDLRVLKAVRETQGLVLRRKGRVLRAYFHSRCGGATDSASDVWSMGPDPSWPSVSCPYCLANPMRWRAEVSGLDLARALGLRRTADLGPLVARRSAGGRILDIAGGNSAKSVAVTADSLRAKLGYTRIKSGNFNWIREGERFVLSGTGFGHGVGMCQWGARYLASRGLSFKEILVYYYPGATVN